MSDPTGFPSIAEIIADAGLEREEDVCRHLRVWLIYPREPPQKAFPAGPMRDLAVEIERAISMTLEIERAIAQDAKEGRE